MFFLGNSVHILSMKFNLLLLLTAAVALVPAHSQAVTQTQYATDVNLVRSNNTVYSSFNAFNSTLGTLNSVTFSIDAINVSGSVVLTQGAGNGLSITNFHADADLNKGISGPVYNGISTDQIGVVNAVNLSVANQTLPFNISRNTVTTFTLNNQNVLNSSRTFDVSSGNFTGVGYAPSFSIYFDVSALATTNGNTSFDWSGLTSKANLSLIYDYTAAVPEPSTYGIGLGVLALAAVAVRRRNKAKA